MPRCTDVVVLAAVAVAVVLKWSMSLAFHFVLPTTYVQIYLISIPFLQIRAEKPYYIADPEVDSLVRKFCLTFANT